MWQKKQQNQPNLRQLENDKWSLETPFKAPYGPEVPAGFLTDLMTSPKWFEIIGVGDKFKSQQAACIVHDYQCINPSQYSRASADWIFFKNLVAYGNPIWKSFSCYLAVRSFAIVQGK